MLWRNTVRSYLFLVLIISAPTGYAQSLSIGKGSTSGTSVVKADYVSEKAVQAFESTLGRRVAKARSEADPNDPRAEQRFDRAVSRLQAEFTQRLHTILDDLAGDGVLEISEVTEEVGHLRDELLSDLDQMLEAIRKGHPPPPRLREFDDRWTFAKQLAHYTLNVRNAPIDWGMFALYVAGGLLVAWLISRGTGLASRLTRGHGLRSTAFLLDSLAAPLYMVAAITGLYLGLESVWVPGIAEPALDKAIDVALILALFWFLWGTAKAVASGIGWLIAKTYNKTLDHHIEVFILRLTRVIIIIAFAISLVQVVLSAGLTGLLTGLGVIGVALSFILRGSIENLAASFTLFGDKPVRVGDIMIYQDHWGKVEDIGFRALRFRTFDGHLFSIPNSEIINEAIQNVGARPFIRRRFRISLTYDTPAEKVREAMDIVADILKDHEGRPDDQQPHVLFERYGDYDLRILVQYYFQPPEYWDALELDSKVNLEILKRFNEAGLKFAFPTQTTVLKTDPSETPELVCHKRADPSDSQQGDDREQAQTEGPKQHSEKSQDKTQTEYREGKIPGKDGDDD